MSVHLNPHSSLDFNRPFNQLVKRTLTVRNNNAQPVAFKVKTTAPKLYCVRPNSGRIEPGDTMEVSVMLQPMKDEPPTAVKCKDKFLIQSTLITPDKETKGLQDIWNVTDAGEEWKVYQQKLRVVYLPPEGQTLEEEDEEDHLEASPPSKQVDPPFGTAVRQHAGNGTVRTTAQVIYDEGRASPPPTVEIPQTPPPVDYTVAREESQDSQTFERTSSGGVGVVNVTVHPSPPPQNLLPEVPVPAPKVDPELERRFAEAQVEIQRLRSLLAAVPDPSSIAPESTAAPTELRRRYNTARSDDGSTYDAGTDVGTMVDDTVIRQEGVPLQVVIIIALGVFITTYLFF